MSIELVQQTITKTGYPKIEFNIVKKGQPKERNEFLVKFNYGQSKQKRNKARDELISALNKKFGAKAKAVVEGDGKLGFINVKTPTSKLNSVTVTIKPDLDKKVSDDEQESLHAYYYCKEIEGDPVTDKNGKPKQSTKVKAIPLKNVYDKCDLSWHDSGKFSAKTFQKRFGLGRGYSYFQRKGSTWVDNLYKVAVKLYKEADVPFSNANKWNPADMWICKDPETTRKEIDDMGSITQLNGYLRRHLDKKTIIGISLKKMNKVGKIDIANMKRKDLRKIKFIGFDYGKQNEFSTGGNIYFSVDGDTKNMSIRSFSIKNAADISGEITGVGALAGKVGYTEINRIFKKFGLETVNKNTKIRTEDQEKLFEFLIKEQKKVKLATTINKPVEYRNALGTVGGVNINSAELEGWLISKVQSIETIMSINSAQDKEKILLAMFAYASSTTKDSGPFVKVSN